MGVYAVALDPGGTTGIAVCENQSLPWHLWVGEIGGRDHHEWLYRTLITMEPEYIICETFENRGQSNTILVSKEYIGVVKLYTQQTDTVGVWQSASTGKAFWSDAMLKKHGLYVSAQRHSRDAIRHYAAWRTFTIGDRDLIADRVESHVRKVAFR